MVGNGPIERCAGTLSRHPQPRPGRVATVAFVGGGLAGVTPSARRLVRGLVSHTPSLGRPSSCLEGSGAVALTGVGVFAPWLPPMLLVALLAAFGLAGWCGLRLLHRSCRLGRRARNGSKVAGAAAAEDATIPTAAIAPAANPWVGDEWSDIAAGMTWDVSGAPALPYPPAPSAAPARPSFLDLSAEELDRLLDEVNMATARAPAPAEPD